MELNHTVIQLIDKLKNLSAFNAESLASYHVRDNSMYPKLNKGDLIEIDRQKPAKHGDIVAIASEELVDFRVLQAYKGGYLLVAINDKYPKISLKDYCSFSPDAFLLGVVV